MRRELRRTPRPLHYWSHWSLPCRFGRSRTDSSSTLFYSFIVPEGSSATVVGSDSSLLPWAVTAGDSLARRLPGFAIRVAWAKKRDRKSHNSVQRSRVCGDRCISRSSTTPKRGTAPSLSAVTPPAQTLPPPRHESPLFLPAAIDRSVLRDPHFLRPVHRSPR